MSVRWRPGYLFLLFLQAFWLNVVLPGHQRGLIVLPGPDSTPSQQAACDTAPTKCCHEAKPETKPPADSPNPSRKAHCAVCAFAARLTVPPAPLLAPTLLELRPETAPIALHNLFESDLPPVYWGRGPPAV